MVDINELMKNPFQRKSINLYEYWERNKIVGKYGVPYLDRELGGIAKTDLVVIGARSGAGKSSLARIIYNANDKTKTALFSLENYDGDVEMALLRKEYNIFADTEYSSRQWQTGEGVKIDQTALKMATRNVEEKLEGSFIFGRTPPKEFMKEGDDENVWTIKSLSFGIEWCATRGIDLIIIDHLDYLDRDNPNESDNSHITELMKTIRKAQELGSAIVAFSHLRKPQGKVDNLVVPNENEFIGSSNKSKQATQVVLFAPAGTGDATTGYDTWCCIRKNRNGGVKNQAAKMKFIPLTETYDRGYDLYTMNYAGTQATKLETITGF